MEFLDRLFNHSWWSGDVGFAAIKIVK
ncbi:uncharacterized protein METZ01_LOCUS435199, partial [marine metagenome]